jgi:hypothetical protein
MKKRYPKEEDRTPRKVQAKAYRPDLGLRWRPQHPYDRARERGNCPADDGGYDALEKRPHGNSFRQESDAETDQDADQDRYESSHASS